MGASDWAGRMCMQLEEEFGVSEDRALRITTLVRLLRGEGYEGVFGEYGTERHEQVQKQLIDDLDKSLREQPGDTIEERWNSLMDELDCQSRADKGVTSFLGKSTTAMTGRTQASHAPAREPIPEIPGKLCFPQSESRYSVGIGTVRIGQNESFPETTRSRF